MRIITVVLVLLIATSLTCMAAESPKVALEASDTPIEQVVADLAKQSGVQIICDKDIKGTVTGHFASIEMEKLLDTITKSNTLVWQKLYIPTKAEQKPTIEQIKARAEAVTAVSGSPIIVCDSATGKQKVFIEQNSASPSVDPDKLGMSVVYLISKPKDETAKTDDKDLNKRIQAIQQERMELLAKMTPEERTAAMQQEMLSMMSMTPEARQDMMLAQMNARRSMDQQTRAQYQQMMRDTFQSMREQGLMPEGRGWPGGGGGRGQHQRQQQ
ncbi:MAG: hypothetical protein ABFD54_00415 [Armatimonadota bacterium]|nr:hypothetical protein [bacterium]